MADNYDELPVDLKKVLIYGAILLLIIFLFGGVQCSVKVDSTENPVLGMPVVDCETLHGVRAIIDGKHMCIDPKSIVELPREELNK